MRFGRAILFRDTSLPPRTIFQNSSKSRTTHLVSYGSVWTHSICTRDCCDVATQVQVAWSVSYLHTAHASQTCSTRSDRTSSLASSLFGMNHRSTVSNFEEPPHRNLLVTRRGSYDICTSYPPCTV